MSLVSTVALLVMVAFFETDQKKASTLPCAEAQRKYLGLFRVGLVVDFHRAELHSLCTPKDVWTSRFQSALISNWLNSIAKTHTIPLLAHSEIVG